MSYDEHARVHLDEILKLPLEDLVEQLRIANLIALAKIAGDPDKYPERLTEAAYGALDALTHTKSVPNGHMDPHEVEVLRPEIAAALKIQ